MRDFPGPTIVWWSVESRSGSDHRALPGLCGKLSRLIGRRRATNTGACKIGAKIERLQARDVLNKKKMSKMTHLFPVGNLAYHGPCPAKGDPPHRYAFTIYALGVATPPVDAGAPAAMATSTTQDSLLGKDVLVIHHSR